MPRRSLKRSAAPKAGGKVVFDLWNHVTWQPAQRAILAILPSKTLEKLTRFSPDEMYADKLQYLERTYTESQEDLERLASASLGAYTHVRAFHCARSMRVDKYFESGIKPLTRESLYELCLERLPGLEPNEKQMLGTACNSADLITRENCLYFGTDKEFMTNEVGHYLLNGPEAILEVSLALENLKLPRLAVTLRRNASTFGFPTVFECNVPVDAITEVFQSDFSRRVLTHVLQRHVDPSYQLQDRDVSIAIDDTLQASNIVGHTHPVEIGDPFNGSRPIKNPYLTCPICPLHVARS